MAQVAGIKPNAFTTLIATSHDLGLLASSHSVSLMLRLKNPNAVREANDLAAMYRPGSRTFHRTETLQQVLARYGPPAADVARAQTWLRTHALTNTWHRGDSWLLASGPVRAVERAFAVRIHAYRTPQGTTFYTSPHDPAVPAQLRSVVAGVARISSYFPAKPAAIPVGGLSPTDLLKAYDITPLRDAGMDGTGQTVVFFELDGFKQADFDAFTQKYNLPPIQPIIKAGPVLSKAEGETEMDLEVVHAIAPMARLVIYNIDWAAVSGQATTFADLGNKTIPLQTQMINENPGAIISESWGLCDAVVGNDVSQAYKSFYDRADLMGETAYVSTGDSGGYTCLEAKNQDASPSPDSIGASIPSTAPGVTAVGGTRLSVRQDGSWYREEVWEEPALTEGGGGGVSAFLPIPTWQQGVAIPSLNPQSLRQVPDVSADADPATGSANYINGSWQLGGGTSQSAPIWAGITALMNQYLKSKGIHTVGFMNPALYALAADNPQFPPFHDVTVGTNLVYPAGPGYDLATGLGTPDAWNLTRDLETYLKSH